VLGLGARVIQRISLCGLCFSGPWFLQLDGGCYHRDPGSGRNRNLSPDQGPGNNSFIGARPLGLLALNHQTWFQVALGTAGEAVTPTSQPCGGCKEVRAILESGLGEGCWSGPASQEELVHGRS
jgi:hypothetical protein